ncbi:hypothetical protein BWQ96_02548 [Gracilariopsis chorda]|uniref:No apical meristem-associated C-terminal domain-containing protein n=1 Tax=Gracilariopsis chorda TaxID=448386 RepID=A0A2V3IZU4_9FLOR|nr:hypothetical protein BWQ96_02548 [Gracilariopsis chorda]|eukprot:PXF47686.1 hypothetical protein BWQ96_02548 [Gracilariopsis chorda]
MVQLASAFLNGRERRDALDDCGKPFRFVAASKVLKNNDKFRNVTVEQRDEGGIKSVEMGIHKFSSHSNLGSDNMCEDANLNTTDTGSDLNISPPKKPTGRPVGRKHAKVERSREKYNETKLRFAAQSMEAVVERNRLLKRNYEIMLLTSAPDGCDISDLLEYFKIMRAHALEELRVACKKQRSDSDSQTEVCNSQRSEGTDDFHSSNPVLSSANEKRVVEEV